MAGTTSSTEIEALDKICDVLSDNLPGILVQLTALSTNVTSLEAKMEQLRAEIDSIKVQVTATERAFKEAGPKTLGDNIQDIRDIQEEGFCRAKDVLRKQGFSQQGDRCRDA
jgi:phage shock protein A